MYTHFTHELSYAIEQLQLSLCAESVDPSSSLTHTQHMSVTNEADFMQRRCRALTFASLAPRTPSEEVSSGLPPAPSSQVSRDLMGSAVRRKCGRVA